MRTAYKCRAYPTPEQAAVFNRTFGCVRLVWNKTLADRHAAFFQRGEKTSYDLGTRHWTCPACRTRHDRDINAAKNILAAGRAVAGTPGDACGADVRQQGETLLQSAVKQETHAARRPA
ncbi:helix-turn-helix domain-containing protein [Actinoplanes sp. NPDC051851]|uniref:helix-turn-helix domain-containing protein n=1 Tax=Actinoplanes sp. NPDC051851 TaxID=3154753 RepID=UPI0034340289